jgi:ABC-type nitrate/sulfonate/bicarbonate transport system ATPase subunit
MKNTMISCKNVKKTFISGKHSFEVIRNLDLEVKENEFLVLFGHGQVGKSTILNIIAGLEVPTEGTVIVNDKKVEAPDPDRGMVYQTIALFPWLTVLGNVSFGPKMRGIKKSEYIKKAKYFIKLVGLEGFENHYPIQISGGMKQRVGIARAYCNDPSVLLMDEPFGHLDAQTRYMMQEEIERIWEKEKRTVVFVTNNIEEAIFLADRMVILDSCPTSVKTEYIVDLPRPRDYTDPKFLKIRQEITDIMSEIT